MAIFFDIDDTLLDSKSAHQIALKYICTQFSLGIYSDSLQDKWRQISDKYLNLYFTKMMTLEEHRVCRIKELAEYIGLRITDQFAKVLYEHYHRCFIEHCSLFNETLSVLTTLKKFKLGIISNGPMIDQVFKLQNNNIFHFFEPIVISEEAGVSKPQKEIFEIAANRANAKLADCIFVGDSLELDYLGSVAVGMYGILIDRTNNTYDRNILRINSLTELIGHKCFTDTGL